MVDVLSVKESIREMANAEQDELAEPMEEDVNVSSVAEEPDEGDGMGKIFAAVGGCPEFFNFDSPSFGEPYACLSRISSVFVNLAIFSVVFGNGVRCIPLMPATMMIDSS